LALTKCGEIRRRVQGEVGRFDDVDRQKARALSTPLAPRAESDLPRTCTYGILDAYRVPVAPWRVASDAAEAEQLAGAIGYPVVVKADSATLLHKSDQGGVALRLGDGQAVRQAVERMKAAFGAPDLRFLVQRYVNTGKEIIIGGKTDDEVGPLVMFGLGGIHVEVLKDVVFRLCPVTDVEAEQMISSLKGSPILTGIRGEKGVDRKAIADTIRRVSHMLLDLPMIREMDLNPLIAREDGVFAVDARMTL
jgi:acetyltransferase